MNKKILLVFGTRPEAIKMVPVWQELLKNKDFFETKICVTGQHRQMLDQVLNFFSIIPEYDLDIMEPNQTLHSITSNILVKLKSVLENFKPDWLLVHGDTTTTLAASLSSFYSGIKVAHVEAGLRTFNMQSPFPEEMNRVITTKLASFHFAPTLRAKQNLLNEGVLEKNIAVTGNTVIDALFKGLELLKNNSTYDFENYFQQVDFSKKVILVTGHRRENFGDGFNKICEALKILATKYHDVEIVYPVHLNPNVQDPVKNILGHTKNIHLISPLPYEKFIWLMEKCYLIITDSGGVQEEAPSLGKPVLVIRNTTERPEAVDAGTVILVGTDTDVIINEASQLIEDNNKHKKFSQLHNPYGDGNASKRIIEILKVDKC